jgi:hypothetical protein
MAAELPAKVDHGVLTAKIRQSAASLAAAWKLPKLRIMPGSRPDCRSAAGDHRKSNENGSPLPV